MKTDPEFDLAIIGSGSAAFAAAIRARGRGASVLMLESQTLGGTCVNVGCVPSKFMLRAAELRQVATDAGYRAASNGADGLGAVVDQKDDLVGMLRRLKYENLVEQYGFAWRKGIGRFADARTLSVDGETIRAKKYLIATGSSPKIPPIEGLADTGFLTSSSALDLRRLPKTLAVIGGNAVGLELAQYFARMGSRVVVLEALARIAPFEELEVSEALTAALSSDALQIRAGVRVQSVSASAVVKHVHFTDGAGVEETIEVDEILVATGRAANTSQLNPAAAGVELTADGAIAVDAHLRTSNPVVYAAGDVTGAPQFVYVAGYQGALAADNALRGERRRVDLRALPRVMFTSPQVAAVGMAEAEAIRHGIAAKVAVLPIGTSVPRALVNASGGVIKMVADRSNDRILGVHIVAENAAEVIQSATLAVQFNLTVADLLKTFHPYLTMAESLKLVAQSFERDVAALSCCAS